MKKKPATAPRGEVIKIQTSESRMDEKFMQEFERRVTAQKSGSSDPLRS